MAGKSKDPDKRSFDGYFEVPPVPGDASGSFDFDGQLRNHLNTAIKNSPLHRSEIAAGMTDLIFGDAGDGEVTKCQLDSWTGPSRTDWRFPLSYLSAFIKVTGAFWVLDRIAGMLGCKILVGEQALLAELGAVVFHERRLRTRKGQIEKTLGSQRFNDLMDKLGGAE